MSDELFFQTIQYLDCLYDQGLMNEKKVKKLARFSLDLGGIPLQKNKTRSLSAPKHFTPPDETDEILSDVLVDDWNKQ